MKSASKSPDRPVATLNRSTSFARRSPHYVLDEWFEQEVKLRMKGRCFLSRFADDFVIGFELEMPAG